MRLPGRTERRLALAILLTAVIPLVAAIALARSLATYAFDHATPQGLGRYLDDSLGVYEELARALKDGMRHEADAIAAREPLRAAALLRHSPSIDQELARAFPRYPDLVSLAVEAPDGAVIGRHDRGRGVDDKTERKLEVRRPLGDGDDAPSLVAVFATSRERLEQVARAGRFVQEFHQIDRLELEPSQIEAFAALLGITIVIAVVIGTRIARSVTRRIDALAHATQAVGAGDLSVRVASQGDDEIADLSRAFNRMVGEVERSRARIEFLQRMATWQEMARRLAHEIKNPLTPILLAVEECHRKYPGEDAGYRRLLDTTLEIVEEEVGTLRRLVGEFSSFARLPRAELSEGDLAEWLDEQRERMSMLEDEGGETQGAEALRRAVAMRWSIPRRPMPAAFDRQMLHRVLVNVLRNAAQAILGAGRTGTIEVHVDPEPDGWSIVVDDDGPGVRGDVRESIFDPYVTTKSDGTGLGLAIVKKIVVEHGGNVELDDSPLGGARIRIRIPRLGSAWAHAAGGERAPISHAPRATGT